MKKQSAAANQIIEEGIEVDDDSSDDDDHVKAVNVRKADYSTIDKWFDSLQDDEDSIDTNGILKFADELGIDAETDSVMLVLAEIMKAKQILHFSRQEFRTGMTALGCDSPASLKPKLAAVRNQLLDKRRFKEIYLFLYSYALDAGQKIMSKDMAIGLWKLLFPQRFALFPKWIQFFEKNSKHGVSKDLWGQFLAFTELPGMNEGDFTAFDAIDAWPLVLDEFVSFIKG